MYTVAVLINDRKLTNANQLMDLKFYFSEFHLIEGKDQSTQLYYKIYEILDRNKYTNILMSQAILKTNHKYSGTIKNHPPKIINDHASLV